MPKPTPSLYSVHKTTIWFAVASIFLLVSLLLTVAQDYAREWKDWQRKFMRFKYEGAQAELREAAERLDRKKLEELKTEEAKTREAFKAQRPQYEAIQKEIGSFELELTKARTRYQDFKQYQDSYKYFIEEYRLHQDPRARETEEKLKALLPQLEEAKLRVERLEKEKEKKELEDI